MWRAWVFVSGVPLGLFAVLAARPLPAAPFVGACGLLAGAGWLGLIGWLRRRQREDPERHRRLVASSGIGMAGWPAAVATWLGLPPGPVTWAPLLGLVATLGLMHAARTGGRGGGWLRCGAWAAASVAGALAVELTWLVAPADVDPPALDDASGTMAPAPIPPCQPDPRAAIVRSEAGAHPRLDARGGLWFDARGRDGSRHVYRSAAGEARCWTCGEPGSNRRPAPTPDGSAVAFETDRHASWREPANWEIHVMRSGEEAPARRSRRLTFGAGPDLHPLLGPRGRTLVWLRGRAGRTEVVLASIGSGHGGIVLGPRRRIGRGGSGWIAPLAWSPGGRALALAYGQPYGHPRLRLVRGVGASGVWLGPAGVRAAAFSGEPGALVLAAGRRARALGLLPDSLGVLLGAWEASRSPDAPTQRATRIFWVAASGRPLEIDLGGLGPWGEPTGLAVGVVPPAWILGQRRVADGRIEERLVEIPLRCRAPAPAG